MKLLFLMFSMFTLSSGTIPGKFCGNIIGNSLNVSLNKQKMNISIDIFGQKTQCNNELYNLTDDKIDLTSSKGDCLNTFLRTHGACPCPPDVFYNGDNLSVNNTPIGTIIFNSCS